MAPVGVHVGFNRSLTDSDEAGLIAFGKLMVGPKEIELKQQGMAVRVRSGIELSNKS